jgi:hypothetical protein
MFGANILSCDRVTLFFLAILASWRLIRSNFQGVNRDFLTTKTQRRTQRPQIFLGFESALSICFVAFVFFVFLWSK